MPKLDLTDATVVVTGAAHGMGAEVARLLAERGAGVALLDRDAAGLEQTRSTILSSPAVVYSDEPPITLHPIDLTDDAPTQEILTARAV